MPAVRGIHPDRRFFRRRNDGEKTAENPGCPMVWLIIGVFVLGIFMLLNYETGLLENWS
jgi:hypothetical protein